MLVISLLLLITLAATGAYSLQPRARSTVGTGSRGIIAQAKDDDFIDIDASTGAPIEYKGRSSTTSDGKNTGGLLGAVFGGLARAFGGVAKNDQEKALALQRRQQKQEIDRGIDQILKGTGLAGGLIGGVVKGIAGMVSDAVADSQQDMQTVNALVEQAIEQDDECSRLLGSGLRLSAPYSSSSSSTSVNGVSSKTVQLMMNAQGSRDTAAVQVQATSSGGKLQLSGLVLQMQSSGKIVRVVSSGRGGGGGGGGGPRGKVVDVGGAIDVI